jgi:predicted transposase/invertase (TIGR01784 family)
MSVLKNPHDRFFKEVFSRPEVAADFLRQYLPAEVSQLLNTATLRLRKDSFIDPDLQQQYADLLYAVRLIDKRPAWVYVLFEHKSYPQPRMAFDMLRYMVRIWEQGTRGKEGALAPIIPIVIYHGPQPWREPVNMAELYQGPQELRLY